MAVNCRLWHVGHHHICSAAGWRVSLQSVKLNWTLNWDWNKMFSSKHPVLQGRNLRTSLLLRSAHTHTHTHTHTPTPPCRCVFQKATCSHMFSSCLQDHISTSPLWLPVPTGNSFCSFFSPPNQPLSVSDRKKGSHYLESWDLRQTLLHRKQETSLKFDGSQLFLFCQKL